LSTCSHGKPRKTAFARPNQKHPPTRHLALTLRPPLIESTIIMTDDPIAMPDHSLPILFTIKQAAELLGASTKTIRRWIDADDLIAHRIGHQFRISEPDLQTFIRTRRNA